MSEAVVLEFSGVGAEEYREVNGILELDPETGGGDWPSGLMCHTGATSADRLVVFEVWETQQAAQDFMSSRLGPALAKAGMPEPARVEWLAVQGHHTH